MPSPDPAAVEATLQAADGVPQTGEPRRQAAPAATAAELDRFARANLDRAVRLAWRLVGADHAAAEDVVQDALLAAHRSLASFRGDSKLDTWFFRILYRKASNYRRWRALRPSFDGDVDTELSDPGRLDTAADAEIARRIDEALARLSGPQRGAFVLVHLEGYTCVEAGRLMGKAPGTVKSHLHRSLEKLRKQLADLAPGDDR
jgi:RNA polymerase sigma-70 factor (ECF subfamily)